MRKAVKRLITLGTILCLMVSSSIMSFAGEWKQNDMGWWYENDDGSYTKGNWQLIDNKWYHFNSDGYMQSGCGLTLDGNLYVLMQSGALETNRDYGFGSSDENGVFTFIDIFTAEQEENVYAQYCEQFGINMKELFSGLNHNREYTINCSNVNFPKNGEGGTPAYLVAETINKAIKFNIWYAGIAVNGYSYTYHYDEAANSFTMTFKISDSVPAYISSIIMY